jgi:hypothetical protein
MMDNLSNGPAACGRRGIQLSIPQPHHGMFKECWSLAISGYCILTIFRSVHINVLSQCNTFRRN